ncbi:unnamed protein product [Peronospora destructor]|uniref:tRNA-uridine aminocarboxypropyltransferase n=1 Tax=Peronospora destructor TaxID=86335 RepID=A0AAV0VC83_9STRA|nr:unnamed protein product [Peronospora destructor]
MAREACTRCKRPPRICYCAWLPDEGLATKRTHVLVLQHTHEKRRRAAISSVPILTQTLEDVTLVIVDDDCDCGPGMNEELDVLLYGGGDDKFDEAMILFPDEHAQPLGATSCSVENIDITKRVLLLVIDGASLQYICLDSNESGDAAIAPSRRSIYGDLRKEPMEGCMSTLEAVASALIVLEPEESHQVVYDSLLHAFEGMVSIQKQFQWRSQVIKLEQYGGILKAEAIEIKRLELQRQQLPRKIDIVTTDKKMSTSVRREYVFYTSHMDFRHRQQLTQQVIRLSCDPFLHVFEHN